MNFAPRNLLEYCRLAVGERQALSHLANQLTAFEYERVDQVVSPGEWAIHGGVLDVFPATFELPLRIELEGSQIASIRSFNPKTLETLERHTLVVILPRSIRTRISV